MYNLNKLDIGNDNNSCIKENIMCFTVEKLIDLGLYKGDKSKYTGKVELNIENETNISTALYFQRENDFNIVSSYVSDFSKNKEEIKNGGFSGNVSEYTICSCDEFGSSESTPTFTFYLGGINNPEYTNTENVSAYLNWSYSNINSYCLTEENDSSNCEWKSVSENSVTTNYTLDGEDGIKKVYAFIKDNSGNIKPSVSDIIQLDTGVPVVTAEVIFNNTENAKIIITSSKDGIYCINKSNVQNDMNNCVEFSNTNRILATQSIITDVLKENGEYYVHVKDSAENIGISNKVNISLSSKNIGEYLLNNPTTGLNTTLEVGLYRYQGTSVNNYICFGTSSKDTCLNNTDVYIYRIIGIASDGRIKVMKNYALESTMQWYSNYTTNITWPNSTLYSSINGSSFLTNTSYVPNGWEDKIEDTIWKYGDNTNVNVTADELYNIENAWTDTVDAKIGLIYAHDYAYAYQSGGLNCSTSGSYSTCKTSWMHISVSDPGAPSADEWTMSRYNFDRLCVAWNVLSNGQFFDYYLDATYSVRPVFYLKSSVQFEGGTGTSTDPFRIS